MKLKPDFYRSKIFVFEEKRNLCNVSFPSNRLLFIRNLRKQKGIDYYEENNFNYFIINHSDEFTDSQ